MMAMSMSMSMMMSFERVCHVEGPMSEDYSGSSPVCGCRGPGAGQRWEAELRWSLTAMSSSMAWRAMLDEREWEFRGREEKCLASRNGESMSSLASRKSWKWVLKLSPHDDSVELGIGDPRREDAWRWEWWRLGFLRAYMAEASREVILAAGRAGKLAGDCPSEHGEHMAKMVE